MGREPSGNPFNSLVQLEYEKGFPRNPFINAGALVVTDRLISLYPRPKEAILDFVRDLCGNDDIYYDHRVAQSERAHADRNMALAYFMKDFGNIHNDVETLIDVYCHQCAIAMTCRDLANSFLVFAHRGVNPFNRERILTVSQTKRLGAVMATCGFYDESGDFAFRVGLPGKSGVGGGIAAYMSGARQLRQFAGRHRGPRALHHRHRLLHLLTAAVVTFSLNLGPEVAESGFLR